MKKITLVTTLLVAILVAGCSKDQKVVRQLEGEWKITGMTNDGAPADKEDYENTTYTFEKCKVSKGDCNGVMKYNDPSKGNMELSFLYNISEKGEKIAIKVNYFGLTQTTDGTIIEHSKTKFVYEFDQEDTDNNGNPKMSRIVSTMEKI